MTVRNEGLGEYLPLTMALATASLLQWLGASAVLPLLPLYLHDHGHTDQTIGIVMAAFFAAGVLAQLLSGPLGDRTGHRGVLLAGLLGYAVFSAGFLTRPDGTGYALLRAGQGATAGAAEVAMLSLVTSAVPVHLRGRAVSAVYGGQLIGVAIGPLLGSVVGMAHMGTLFLGSAVLAFLAGIPVLAWTRRLSTPAATFDDTGDETGRTRSIVTATARSTLLGALLTAAILGLLTGIYEACWTLLLDDRGATAWQVSLSWTLFALPFALAAPVAGWMADHWDRRLQVVSGVMVPIGLAFIYPWLHDLRWLIGLGMVESVGFAFAYPAVQSLLTEAVPIASLGWAQGKFAALQTAAIALAAGVSGWMFSRAVWMPFVVVAVVSLVLTILLGYVWRQIPGRIRER
jgi:DHA1 family multidrug resistance protein-like MFS transporter